MNPSTSSNLACSKLLGDLASSFSIKLESGNLPLPSGLGKTPATEKKNDKNKQANTEKNFFRWMGTNVYFLDEWIITGNTAYIRN